MGKIAPQSLKVMGKIAPELGILNFSRQVSSATKFPPVVVAWRQSVPLHPIALLCMFVLSPLASVCPSCDRKVPMVF